MMAVYQTQEFAELAGVTVRTLHHYDRIGLLKASRRTAAGYRLYGESDLRRLEQIVVLKFLGLSLREIRDALQKGPKSLGEVLARQRGALEAKRDYIGVAVRAIAAAERALAAGSQTDTQIFEIIRSVTEMDNSNEWMMQYYSPAARAKIEERAKTWTPELQAQCEKDWAELLAEVRDAMARGDDPASPHVQALAARWKALVEGFTGGDPEVTEGLKRLYADRANWQGDLDEKVDKFPVDSTMSGYIASAGSASTKRK
jgi:DNA-binding transcriptional MerR regulator